MCTLFLFVTRVIYAALRCQTRGQEAIIFLGSEGPPDDLQISEVSQFGAGGP